MPALIYSITHALSQKVYVGQTWQPLERRWKRHCSNAREKNRKSMPILHAIAKYGQSSFELRLLENCGECTQQFADEREVFWVVELDAFCPNGYNLKAGKSRGKCSDELKAKIGAANKGRKITEETRRRLSDSHRGNKWSAPQIDKMSDYWKGTPLSLLARENSIKSSQKSYTLRDPRGISVVITNMARFCRETGLNKNAMSSLATGARKKHRGWRLIANHGKS